MLDRQGRLKLACSEQRLRVNEVSRGNQVDGGDVEGLSDGLLDVRPAPREPTHQHAELDILQPFPVYQLHFIHGQDEMDHCCPL